MFPSFLRKGDKLMQINGADLQDLTPEELAQMLAEGSPMLVSSRASQQLQDVLLHKTSCHIVTLKVNFPKLNIHVCLSEFIFHKSCTCFLIFLLELMKINLR